MPTSSLRKKSTGTNHYENHNSFLLNELNKGKNSDNNRKLSESDYSQINYSAYQTKETGKTSFNYYNDHRYENLDTTDYISWSCVKDDTFDYQLEEDAVVVVGEGEDNDTTRKVGEKVSDNTGECGFRVGLVGGDWCRDQDVPDAPTRDPVSLKSIKYGPGHEKYPSWPGSVRPDTSDKPQRSHSWTEKTTYPKEKVTSYARPYTKRTNASFTQQLKTVMERCEKITPESYQKTMEQVEEREKRIYLPRLDREGNSLGDQDYMVPSPPERDKPSLTQADLEKYYRENHLTKLDNEDYSTPYDDIRKPPPLTQADLEEYSRSYDDVLKPLHQHQGSYAQSEGYHSYVSSSELTTTPFLDRLRRDSDSGIRSQQWSEEDNRAGRDSVVTTSSGSASSSETLKWHGSMSDVSVSSNSCRSRQLIAHSSRVPPPQRHYSESVLYLGNQSGSNWQSKGDRSQQLKLFPVNTYTVQPNEPSKPVISPTSVPKMSVAERISELERQQQTQRFAYYDPDKRHKVSDPTLKAIQKKALLSFYERHQHATSGMTPNGVPMQSRLADAGWKTEQKLTSPVGQVVSPEASRRISAPPLPPPRSMTSRRASCASDMSLSSWSKANHSYSCSLVGPAIIGPSISVDDWVPELPPKKPHLRSIPPPLPQRSPSPIQVPPTDSEIDSLHSPKSLPSFNRMPTPDLPPPPPPPPTVEEEVVSFDEPLPPPPPEVEWHLATAVPIRSTPMSSGRASPQSPVRYSPVKDCSDVESTRVVDQNENIRSHFMPDAYEIQYDQNAINAIMESNRLAELQKKKHSSKGKHSSSKDFDEKSPLKVHIENRPPLPLPRDVHHTSERKQDGCDRDTWQSCKENQPDMKVPFTRSISKPENSTRTSVKLGKNDVRSSLRHSSKKPGMLNGKQKGRISPDTCGLPNKSPAKTKSVIEFAKPVAVKKVSEYECRVPIRDRDGLTVFEGPVIEDPKQTTDKSEDVQTYKG
ncbi:hypothetical protein RUM44_009691 [Polyplax serrata]|uniref:Protein Shroom n=1 Tax=Polyplax serrata TaxID=468196 RepID=A0ABR1ATF4_POLSC